MNTNKFIFLLIILFTALPIKGIFAQDLGSDIESDTTVLTELDIKYDSILAKATSALTASSYEKAIEYYKEASALKPNDSYAYRMIKYVEDLDAKQKRADDLKRKAQIKDDLTKANTAIVQRKWDTAKVYFNRVLALHPDKTDEDYAKAKVEAIDLELQRIVVRTPVKEEPKPVYVPKTRREIREQRKLEERNAILAAATNRAIAQ